MNTASFSPPVPSLSKETIRFSSQLEQCERLLRQGADPNKRLDREGVTPLIEAAERGLADIIRCLLKYGANPNLRASSYPHPDEVSAFYVIIFHIERYFLLDEDFPDENFSDKNFVKIFRLLLDNGAEKIDSDEEILRYSEKYHPKEYGIMQDQFKSHLLQDAIYEQRVADMQTVLQASATSSERDQEKAHLTPKIWALLKEDLLPVFQGLCQKELSFKESLTYLPKEIWIQIFIFVLTEKLTDKVVWLHKLPPSERTPENVECAFNQLFSLYKAGQLHKISRNFEEEKDINIPDDESILTYRVAGN